jgi:hypothetical protein
LKFNARIGALPVQALARVRERVGLCRDGRVRLARRVLGLDLEARVAELRLRALRVPPEIDQAERQRADQQDDARERGEAQRHCAFT